MPFTRVRDINMYYQVRGSGPRLMYISGTGGDLRRSPSVFESPLAEEFEILAFDQRGLGQTDRHDTPYTMADYAADADALMMAVGWDRCLVMGVSFGGMVGSELALRYPDRVERLVLACTSSGGNGGSSYPLHKLVELSDDERVRRGIGLSDTRLNAEWQVANPAELQTILDQSQSMRGVGVGEPGRQEGALRQLQARANHDVYDRLPQLRIPVFVCGGRYDGIAPPENSRALAQCIPGAVLDFFEGGHGFLREDPRALESVIAFLHGQLVSHGATAAN